MTKELIEEIIAIIDAYSWEFAENAEYEDIKEYENLQNIIEKLQKIKEELWK